MAKVELSQIGKAKVNGYQRNRERGEKVLSDNEMISIEARDLLIKSPEGKVLAGPLNFSLRAGERVVLVGQSGSGKSWLLNTLTGFLPYEGSLKVNGVELKSLDADRWRRLLSWVGQNPQLPAATLRDNVLLSCPDATEAQLQLALDKAWVSEFLSLLPQGINTPVGDQAGRLSVGQAQRVAVARALLIPCRLLLLDEPLGALDALTRLEMQELIVSLWQEHGFTVLLVTHDVSEAVAMADRVLLIEEKKIGLDLSVDIPRPRRTGSAKLAELEAEVLDRVMKRGKSESAPRLFSHG